MLSFFSRIRQSLRLRLLSRLDGCPKEYLNEKTNIHAASYGRLEDACDNKLQAAAELLSRATLFRTRTSPPIHPEMPYTVQVAMDARMIHYVLHSPDRYPGMVDALVRQAVSQMHQAIIALDCFRDIEQAPGGVDWGRSRW